MVPSTALEKRLQQQLQQQLIEKRLAARAWFFRVFLGLLVSLLLIAYGLHISGREVTWMEAPMPIAPRLDDLSDNFSSVLFVVKYNFDAPVEKIVLHSRLWKHAFRHQVVYGPFSDRKRRTLTDSYNITAVSDADKRGYFAYRVLVDAIRGNPGYSGYLLAHDDIAFDVRRLARVDQKEIWLSDISNVPIVPRTSGTRRISVPEIHSWEQRHGNHYPNTDFEWPWLDAPGIGIDAIDQLIHSEQNSSTSQAIMSTMRACTGHEHAWPYGQSDFLYIPEQEVANFTSVMDTFASVGLFLEIAVHAYVHCLSTSEVSFLKLCTTFQRKTRESLRKLAKYCEDDVNAEDGAVLVHPVKLINRHAYEYYLRITNLKVQL